MPILEEVRTVTADGRVIVPWSIQRALGLEHGGPIQFQVENGVVTLVAVNPCPSEIDDIIADPDVRRAQVRAALAAELQILQEVAERDRGLAIAAE
jgi:bifunctional DNA-binding transcriptional regulator/antitoxin component of YhaV-PrlF toxin-antitoxin module